MLQQDAIRQQQRIETQVLIDFWNAPAEETDGKGKKRKSLMTFGDAPAEETDDGNAVIKNSEQERYLSLLGDAIGGGASWTSGGMRSTIKD